MKEWIRNLFSPRVFILPVILEKETHTITVEKRIETILQSQGISLNTSEMLVNIKDALRKVA